MHLLKTVFIKLHTHTIHTEEWQNSTYFHSLSFSFHPQRVVNNIIMEVLVALSLSSKHY